MSSRIVAGLVFFVSTGVSLQCRASENPLLILERLLAIAPPILQSDTYMEQMEKAMGPAFDATCRTSPLYKNLLECKPNSGINAAYKMMSVSGNQERLVSVNINRENCLKIGEYRKAIPVGWKPGVPPFPNTLLAKGRQPFIAPSYWTFTSENKRLSISAITRINEKTAENPEMNDCVESFFINLL